MPVLIEHIDAIARIKQRDVLYVTFHPKQSDDDDSWGSLHDWKNDPMRETVCNWFAEHNIVAMPPTKIVWLLTTDKSTLICLTTTAIHCMY